MNLKFIIFAGLLISNLVYGQEIVQDIVYEDTNQNGQKESKEKKVGQVAVSNGVDAYNLNFS